MLQGAWIWLQRNPVVAVNAIPLGILSYIEGTGAVPFFMLIMGVLWQRSVILHQRRVASLAIILGVVVLSPGRPLDAPEYAAQFAGRHIPWAADLSERGLIGAFRRRVPALNRLGVSASEAEMAELTGTRPGFGAILIRAMDGLNQKLVATDLHVVLVQPTYEELLSHSMPALTPLYLEPSRRHMIMLQKVTPVGVWMADPIQGGVYMSRMKFEDAYTQQVLVFKH